MSVSPANNNPAMIYQPVSGLVDDAFDADGQIKPHWHYLLGSLDELGAEAFAERQQKALRILRDDGATYNIYGDTSSPAHTWGLDLVPNIISSDDWADVEAGLLERAELFNLLLRDIYGQRRLIKTGVIPPEALFCHRGFLRACHGIQLPGDHDLIIHAVDLMRGADGRMWVLGDRTQSPSGAGYALENRTVMSRVFPSLFRDSHVHRLAAFFQRLRAKLISLSPNIHQPRVAVLTPGAHNETYFEHAYMANYLGFPLVQSDDLVVRNGFLWMKSLDGLSRVDVLLRRVDDWFCDPVELRSDSRLGVAGLLEVVRAGNLVVANPLGSGVLENPVFLRYLPEIAKALLGRELRLPSVPTYWCGDQNDLDFVQKNFSDLVIKPVYRNLDSRSVQVAGLSADEQQQLLAKIKAEPLQYVAQPMVVAGHIPTFENGNALVPRPAILRSFAVASDSSYTLMPGGLTRVGNSENSFVIANQAGARSKDTWVVASEPERVLADSAQDDSVVVREADLISLPSRVVENLFWMGRYAERAETTLRMLRTTFMLLNGEEPISDAVKQPLLQALLAVAAIPLAAPADEASDNRFVAAEQRLQQLVSDGSLTNSIATSLNAMLYCADETKELLSSDTFRVINDIRDALQVLPGNLNASLGSAPEEALDPLVTALMAFAGLTQESMSRGFGWRFMEMGRRLERAQQISLAVNYLLVPEFSSQDQNKLAEALLLSLESLISYRRRYRGRMVLDTSLDLVLLDSSNPRSLIYQLGQLGEHLRALPKAAVGLHELSREERTLLETEVLIKLASLKNLVQTDAGLRPHLLETMSRCRELLAEISEQITDKYFDHREASQQLVHSNRESL